jgi:hypothetical protein
MAYDLRHRAVALLYSGFVACERGVRAKDWGCSSRPFPPTCNA